MKSRENIKEEFPKAKSLMPSEVEDIERKLTSFLYDDDLASIFDAKAPQTFEELIMSEKRLLGELRKEYLDTPNARTKRGVDVFELIRSFTSRSRRLQLFRLKKALARRLLEAC